MPATTKYAFVHVELYQPTLHLRYHQWSKIQQKKGINDQRRGQVYARAFRVSNLLPSTRRIITLLRRHPTTVPPWPNDDEQYRTS
jgi:hypothetical protein